MFTLVVDGYPEDPVKAPTIHEKTLKVAIVNVFDLKFFEWFHLLDDGATYEDAVEELNRIAGQPFTKQQLLAIDLADYN